MVVTTSEALDTTADITLDVSALAPPTADLMDNAELALAYALYIDYAAFMAALGAAVLCMLEEHGLFVIPTKPGLGNHHV